MTEFHAQIAGLAVETENQCMTVGFAEEPDGEGASVLISGAIPEEDLPADIELFDNGEYTICIDSCAVAEACVRKWKVEPGKLSMMLSPEGARELEVDEEFVIFFPSESTAMVQESLTKIFVLYGHEGDPPGPWDEAS